jgi:hypothetical protein
VAAVVASALGGCSGSQIVLNDTVTDDLTPALGVSAIVLGMFGIILALGVWSRRSSNLPGSVLAALSLGLVALALGVVGLLREPIDNAGSCYRLRPIAEAEFDHFVDSGNLDQVEPLRAHVVSKAKDLKIKAEQLVAEGRWGWSLEPGDCERLIDEVSHWPGTDQPSS